MKVNVEIPITHVVKLFICTMYIAENDGTLLKLHHGGLRAVTAHGEPGKANKS